MLRYINLWPPFFGAGIRVTRRNPDMKAVDVEMNLRFYNRNYVGTHYGGSLYSMTDPFYMLMLIENLGPEFIVWDKAATIRFRKPGRSTLTAAFRIPPEELVAIREAAEPGEPIDRTYTVDLVDREGVVHASVEKVIYVKRREA